MQLFVYRSRRFHQFVWLAILAYAVWFAVGLVLTARPGLVTVGPWADLVYVVLGATILLLHASGRYPGHMVLVLFGWVALVSGGVETIGALTGFPFGSYTYTPAFGPMILGVLPVAIPLAWWILVWPLHLVFRSALAGRGSIWMLPVLVGLAAVMADLVIEPVAVGARQYWLWEGSGVWFDVPFVNFVGWFFTAAFISFGLQVFLPHDPVKQGELRVPLWVFGTTLFSFVFANLVERHWVPAVLGLGLIALVAKVASLGRRRSLS